MNVPARATIPVPSSRIRAFALACAIVPALLAPSRARAESLLESPTLREPRTPSNNPKLIGGTGSDETIAIERIGGPDGEDEPKSFRAVLYDLRSKTERVIPKRYDDGLKGPPRAAEGSDSICAEEERSDLDGGGAIVFGSDGRSEILNTTVTPWRRIGKIYAWFHDPDDDPATSSVMNEIAFADCVGTGALIGECHVLTAGHVVYNHDPRCGELGWAQKIVFVPGLYTDSSGVVRWPYGSQYATELMSFTAWTQNEDEDSDMGFFVVDEPIGSSTGWFGYSTGSSDNTIRNIAGYPADRSSGLDQFFMAGEINCENTYNLKYKIDTAGGQSGAPIWRYTGSSRYVHGVHAHGGVPFGCGFETQNRGVRITSGKFDCIQDWKAQYECPEPAADLGADDPPRWVLSDTIITSFHVRLAVRNLGTRPASRFRVVAVVSPDQEITRADRVLGFADVEDGLACGERMVVQFDAEVPADVEPGEYYLGWWIDAGNEVEESDERNNFGACDLFIGPSREIGVCKRIRRFLRGDVNVDAQWDIADPIALLRFLYTGDQPPACLDAADNNADGKLDLSDPISSLTELFVGGGGTRSCVEHELSASLGCESYSSCE